MNNPFFNKTFAILGLSRSGLATAKTLLKAGAKIFAYDDYNEPELENLFFIHHEDWPWKEIEALIISPGIPHQFPKPHPAAAQAYGENVPVISDIEVLMRAKPEAKVIGITGTNGKSTTASLLHHCLQHQGYDTVLGGNIGIPALALDDPGEAGFIILELSSYQLETTPSLKLDAGAILNITPDHLDRHGGWTGYVEAKSNLAKSVGPEGILVLGSDDTTRALADKTQAKTTFAEAVMEENSTIESAPHHPINMAVVLAILSHFGISVASAQKAISSFKGLPHRVEYIGMLNNIQFINDSKATNGEAAAEALKGFEKIYWLAGGQAKENGLAALIEHCQHVRKAYLFGEAANSFATCLAEAHIPAIITDNLDHALFSAFEDAISDRTDGMSTILLSPAAASFDQFTSFEARGDHFRHLAQDLINSSSKQEVSYV